MLAGDAGKAMQLAMRLVVKAADIMGAERLIPISFAHLDACFYTGQAHVDFVRFLIENGASLAVETWTNNGVVSLADPTLRPEREDPETVRGAAELMRLYERLGTRPTWTCAPYQAGHRPAVGTSGLDTARHVDRPRLHAADRLGDIAGVEPAAEHERPR